MIEACTRDIRAKRSIKEVMPDLQDSSILKAVRRILSRQGGPKTSTRLTNVRMMAMTPTGPWYDVLDKMNSPKWRFRRQKSGQVLKQALCERFETLRSSTQPSGKKR